MKLYKLTKQDGTTYGGCQWGEGVTHTAPGKGWLCGPGWLHAYTDPLLAVMLNPIHANFEGPRLWEAEGEVGIEDHGLKVGCNRLTTVREIPLPEVSIVQRVAFGILVALEVCNEPEFVAWAEKWLSGKDRSAKAARLVGEMAGAVARPITYASAWMATWSDKAEWATAWATQAVAWAAQLKALDLVNLARRAMEVQ